jgi:hypothetical protein
MIKIMIIIFALTSGIIIGIYDIYSGLSKWKETKDGSFRFLNLFSNRRLSAYSGKEQIFTGVMLLVAAGYLIHLFFFQ